jgi:hypothetical protein
VDFSLLPIREWSLGYAGVSHTPSIFTKELIDVRNNGACQWNNVFHQVFQDPMDVEVEH